MSFHFLRKKRVLNPLYLLRTLIILIFSLGSNASLSPSPRRLKDKIIRLIITAGANNLWGYEVIPPIACDANDPRLGMGAETPRPNKLKYLSVNMDEGICNVVVTINVPILLVNKCFLIILLSDAPNALCCYYIFLAPLVQAPDFLQFSHSNPVQK